MSTPTNAAQRLAAVVDEVVRLGARRSTAPAFEIWMSALGVPARNSVAMLEAVASVHRNIDRLERNVAIASPATHSNCLDSFRMLRDALNLEQLRDPWNNSRHLLGDQTRLSLQTASAALEGRFDELDLRTEQVRSAERFLTDISEALLLEDLPKHIKDFLYDSLSELRQHLARMAKLGPDDFLAKADHLMAQLQRLDARVNGTQHEGVVRRATKAIGIGVASVTAVVALGASANTLDKDTLKMLPWNSSTDPQIIKVVVDGGSVAPILGPDRTGPNALPSVRPEDHQDGD